MPRMPVQLLASVVEVLCPHCGESQPAPDGEAQWLLFEVAKADPKERDCVGCDEPIRIELSRPHLDYTAAGNEATEHTETTDKEQGQ